MLCASRRTRKADGIIQTESKGLCPRSTNVWWQEKVHVPAQAKKQIRPIPIFCSSQTLNRLYDAIYIFTQSNESNANLFRRHLHTHTQKYCYTSYLGIISPLKFTQKINYHSSLWWLWPSFFISQGAAKWQFLILLCFYQLGQIFLYETSPHQRLGYPEIKRAGKPHKCMILSLYHTVFWRVSWFSSIFQRWLIS